MKTQVNQNTTNLCTVLFIGLIIYFLIKNRNNQKQHSDLFEIIYEIERPVISKTINTPRNKIITYKPNKRLNTTTTINKTEKSPEQNEVAEKQPKQKLVKNNFTELHRNCALALVSLGMKKTEANNTVIDIFNKYEDIQSIEDFIKKAFVPNEYYRSST